MGQQQKVTLQEDHQKQGEQEKRDHRIQGTKKTPTGEHQQNRKPTKIQEPGEHKKQIRTTKSSNNQRRTKREIESYHQSMRN